MIFQIGFAPVIPAPMITLLFIVNKHVTPVHFLELIMIVKHLMYIGEGLKFEFKVVL
jgi:hypothetical protein